MNTDRYYRVQVDEKVRFVSRSLTDENKISQVEAGFKKLSLCHYKQNSFSYFIV